MANICDLPQLPRDQWPEPDSVLWKEAELLVGRGYPFKCKVACQMKKVPYKPGWMNSETGLFAAELGAPVHQALFVVTMRERIEVIENGGQR